MYSTNFTHVRMTSTSDESKTDIKSGINQGMEVFIRRLKTEDIDK